MTPTKTSNASAKLISFLTTNGPCLSSIAASYLVSSGISAPASRKAIERSRGAVLRLEKIRFSHNQRFLFLPKQYKKPIFWSSLIESFRITNSVYASAVNSLLARDGAWPVPYFGIVSGSPERLSKHISSSTVLKKLSDIEVIEVVDFAELGECTQLAPDVIPQPPTDARRAMRSRIIAEDILLSGLREWIRNTGLGSWNKVDIRSLRSLPKFGQFNWDFCAPTFVHPMRGMSNTSRPANGFVVGDVLLGKDIQVYDLDYFIRKTNTMRNQNRARPFLAVFLAERYSSAALRAGRSLGLLLVTTETLFGRSVASGLSQLIQALNHAAEAISSNPALVSELFEKLDSLKGATLNVRGWLFELLAAHILKTDGWRIDSIGDLRKDPQSGEVAELDVLAIRGNHAVALECKGYVKSDVSEDEIEKWLTKTVPRIRASLLCDPSYRNKDIEFRFWTTSKFSSEALIHLKEKKAEIQKYQVNWSDGADIMTFSQALKNDYAVRLLREQYEL